MPKQRVVVYLDESDVEYLNSVRTLIGTHSMSDTVRFCLKLLRLIIPRATYIAKLISLIMSEEERELEKLEKSLRERGVGEEK